MISHIYFISYHFLREKVSKILRALKNFFKKRDRRQSAAVVKRIFKLCMEGRGPSQIANQLKADKVLTPTAYKKRKGRNAPNPDPEDP